MGEIKGKTWLIQNRGDKNMDEKTLITQQALQIAAQQEEMAAYRTALKKIRLILYCIGGPLNDNKLGYTKEQLSTFFQIHKLAMVTEDYDRNDD